MGAVTSRSRQCQRPAARSGWLYRFPETPRRSHRRSRSRCCTCRRRYRFRWPTRSGTAESRPRCSEGGRRGLCSRRPGCRRFPRPAPHIATIRSSACVVVSRVGRPGAPVSRCSAWRRCCRWSRSSRRMPPCNRVGSCRRLLSCARTERVPFVSSDTANVCFTPDPVPTIDQALPPTESVGVPNAVVDEVNSQSTTSDPDG